MFVGISSFINTKLCRALGMKEEHFFDLEDFLENKNDRKILDHILYMYILITENYTELKIPKISSERY
jgi:hypothetical protein